MPLSQEEKAQAALSEVRSHMTQQLAKTENHEDPKTVQRVSAMNFDSVNKIKKLIMQNIQRPSAQSFSKYTKNLVRQYLQNPYNYRTQIIGVSRFLWRISTLYRKIILYYALMPLYNYNLIQRMDFSKKGSKNKILKEYESVLKVLNHVNFTEEFATAITLAMRDGVYFGFIYNNGEEGCFINTLPYEYCRIQGKNEVGQWIVYFDATYFTQGNNSIFVEGIDGDTSGCWHECFVQGWNDYQADRQNNRWFMLPSELTLTLLAGTQDEFDNPLPFFTGIMISLLDLIDYEQLLADRTELENYYLLLLEIPTIEGDVVDDFKITLELAEAYKDALADVMPSLTGVGLLPGMTAKDITFAKSNSVTDTDLLGKSINNLFGQTGANQLVVSSGNSTSNYAIKQSIANDMSYTFLLISRLESNFQYFIDKNISENTIFKIHRQTWYNEEEYIERIKNSATLGGSAMRFLTAQGVTPYEAYSTILFESTLGIKSMMEPLESSYNRVSDSDSQVGRPRASDDDLSGSAQRTRDTGSTIAE